MFAVLPQPTYLRGKDEMRWDMETDDPEWEMLFWPRIVFGDMGTFSGVSVIWFDPVKLFDMKLPSEQSMMCWWSSFLSGPENSQAQEMLRLCRGLGSATGLAVGLEKFVVNSVKKDEAFLSSPRIAAKVDFGLYSGIRDAADNELRRRAVLWQMPSEIDMTERGDQRLKQLGMYVGGMDHRNDATKHAITHIRKMKGMGLGAFRKIYGWNPDWITG